MNNIDSTIPFMPINIGLITISDTRKEDNDKSGNLLKERITNFGHKILIKKIVSDDINKIKETIVSLAQDSKMLILLELILLM